MLWFNPAKRHSFIHTDEGERLRVDQDGFAAGQLLADRCKGTRVSFERGVDRLEAGGERRDRAAARRAAGATARTSLMARRTPQSVLKRARKQAMREKREPKQAKTDTRAAERRHANNRSVETDARPDAE